ncbi:MAG: hypothetical protein JNL60_01400, partial [Bacteroidia bacterium]|nr:hypothetical protein [Bacteroidia bacterium]
MGQDLVDIQDLMLLLGYTDPRSVKKWCKQRDIPILSLGLKKYVSQHILTQYIDNQLVKFDKGNTSANFHLGKSNQETKLAQTPLENMKYGNLKLPKKLRPKGLFLFCNACDTHYADDKKVNCKCGRLVYKAVIHVPGTKRDVRPKVLAAQDFKSAITEFLDFKEELKTNNFQKIAIKKTLVAPTLLVDCF